jgi:hypothetical protein
VEFVSVLWSKLHDASFGCDVSMADTPETAVSVFLSIPNQDLPGSVLGALVIHRIAEPTIADWFRAEFEHTGR